MKRNYDESLNALVEALVLLSSDPGVQISYLKGISAADDLADTVDSLSIIYPADLLASKISPDFLKKIETINETIERIQNCNTYIWGDEALRHDKEWQLIRVVSRALLEELALLYDNLPVSRMKATLLRKT